MKSTKLTPLEVLQRQKARLHLKSDALIDGLEDHLDYMQHNIGTIIRNSAMDMVVSKTPLIVQSLLGKGEESEKIVFNRLAVLEGILDIIPFFIKGPKSRLVRLVLNLAKKWIFKKS